MVFTVSSLIPVAVHSPLATRWRLFWFRQRRWIGDRCRFNHHVLGDQRQRKVQSSASVIQTRDIVLSNAYRHWHFHFHFLSVRPPGPVRLDLRSSRYSIIPCHAMQQQLLARHMHMQFDPHIEQRRSTGSNHTSSQFDMMMIELYTSIAYGACQSATRRPHSEGR